MLNFTRKEILKIPSVVNEYYGEEIHTKDTIKRRFTEHDGNLLQSLFYYIGEFLASDSRKKKIKQIKRFLMMNLKQMPLFIAGNNRETWQIITARWRILISK